MGKTVVATLYDLQQLDLDLDRLATEAEALQRALAEDAVRPAREAAARARRQAERERKAASEAEAVLRDMEARIQKQEARLYGGGAATRDLSALQTELGHLKDTHAQQEERVLAAMLALEEADAAVARAAEAQSAAEREWRNRRAELAARLAAGESATAELRGQREAQARAIDPAVLSRYEALRRGHGGRGVALVQNGTCQACHVGVTSGALQRARSGAELVPCNNCGRILYVRST
jgi:predicted  nucleic acid-binding Zn-ribbon protein